MKSKKYFRHFQFLRLAALAITLSVIQLAEAASFTATGSLNTARIVHTATLLPNGKVLIAGGNGSGTMLASAELYDSATGKWTVTAPMPVGREFHTATLLPNGKVLIVGGQYYDGTKWVRLSSGDVYDPDNGAWTTTNGLFTGRAGHTATLLLDGKVLVTGGWTGTTGSDYLSSAELYDPVSGTWTAAGAMHAARAWHTATLLPDGKVLVAGGYNGNMFLSSAEVFDPVTGTWTATGAVNTAREIHTATLLSTGKVLIAGGYGPVSYGSGPLSSAELYDRTTGTWTTTGTMNTSAGARTATLLPNGKVLVAGGEGGIYNFSSAELYDYNSGTWTPTSSLANARDSATATLLPSGQVLIAGGSGGPGVFLSSAELYDSASSSWTATGTLNVPRWDHKASLLPNGKVLVTGGDSAQAELYDPDAGRWSITGALASWRYSHTATLLANGKVLVAGGYASEASQPLSGAELYDATTGTWALTGAMTTPRERHTATLLWDGKVLVAGGDGSGYADLSSAELYDPASRAWTLTGSMNTVRSDHTATLLTNGKVLVAGGWNGSGSLTGAELYDPVSGTWTATGTMHAARAWHTATLLPDGKVLVAGGVNGNMFISSAELYDPTTGVWTPTGAMASKRHLQTATLLPNGKVLVVGGYNGNDYLTCSESWDPATGKWTVAGSLNTARDLHTATLLPNGKVLVVGGDGNNYSTPTSAELYDNGLGFITLWQPQVATATSPLGQGGRLGLTGTRFRGVSEGSGGNGSQSSPSDYPVVQLRSVESGQTLFPSPTDWSANAFMSVPVTNFPSGYALATMFVNGIPSTSSLVDVIAGPPPLPTILASPTNQFVTAGSTVTFTITATGVASLCFQWRKGLANLTDGGNLSGTLTSTLSLSNTLGGDAGGYSVVVSNAYGSETSAAATLTVVDPFISQQPVSLWHTPGQTAVFSVEAKGTLPLSYQWLKEGASLVDSSNVSGAKTSTLTLSNVSFSDAGEYVLIVGNSFNCVTSAMAHLSVTEGPGPGIYVVTNLADSPLLPVPPGSLRQAVIDASAAGGGDIVFFNVSGTISLATRSLPTITNAINIIGPGADVLSITTGGAFGDSSILTFDTNASCTISRLTIGGSSSSVGRVVNLGGKLSLRNCVFTNIVASAPASANPTSTCGGAIFTSGGTLTCSNVAFYCNKAFGGNSYQIIDPGGYAFGGAIYSSGGVLNLTNCNFIGNAVNGGRGAEAWNGCGKGGNGLGGAVYCSGGSATFYQCRWSSNRVSGGDGGGKDEPFNTSPDGKAFGGAIAASNATVRIIECNLTNNCAVGLSDGSEGGAYGGAIYQDGGTLDLIDSFLTANLASGLDALGYVNSEAEEGKGGALCINCTANITNCVFSGNSSSGGSLEFMYFGRTAASGYGGAIYNGGSLRTVSCSFSNNWAYGGNGAIDHDHGGYVVPSGGGIGGAICNSNRLVVVNCWFSENSVFGGGGNSYSNNYRFWADGCGGGIFNGGSCAVTNASFSGNSARGGKGVSTGVIPDPEDDTNAHAGDGDGGGIFNSGTLSVFNSTFYANSTTGGNDLYTGGAGRGGAIYNTTTSLQLNHCTIVSNAATGGTGQSGSSPTSAGGGIYDAGTSWLRNSTLAGNSPGSNYFGVVTDAGYNLSSDASCVLNNTGSSINTDPRLGPFTNNGGPTYTMALLPGSPAIDQGAADGANVDQRGMPRPFNLLVIPNAADGSDIGAYEYEYAYIPIPPFITRQPASLVLNTGQLANFSVVAVGWGDPNLGYQWRKDGATLVDGGRVAGALTSTLTVSNVSLADSGSYSVIVINAFGSTVSAPANLMIRTVWIGGVRCAEPGKIALTICGLPGDVCCLQASTNLLDWESVCTITNVNGTVEYTDTETTAYNQRFYRLVLP